MADNVPKMPNPNDLRPFFKKCLLSRKRIVSTSGLVRYNIVGDGGAALQDIKLMIDESEPEFIITDLGSIHGFWLPKNFIEQNGNLSVTITAKFHEPKTLPLKYLPSTVTLVEN